jgi:tol-pal system protein YbgF
MRVRRAESTSAMQVSPMAIASLTPYDDNDTRIQESAAPMVSSISTFRARSFRFLLSVLMVLSGGSAVQAQDVDSQTLPAVKGEAKGRSDTGRGGGGESAQLRDRVNQLEGQIVDLQVVIGTLESLARTGGAAPAPVRSEAGGGMAGNDRARLDSIETQIRALTAQVEQLAAEVRAGSLQRRSDAGPAAPSGFGGEPQVGRFGSTTVTSDNAGPTDGLGYPDPGARAPAPAAPAGPSTYGSESLPAPGGGDQFAAVDPGAAANPKQLYETAYGHLLQQDYGAAQSGFRDFLRTYPQDPLAPNALYWLGESHYVQRNYADAAEAFDIVVQTYASSGKAPDAQLKRGMALAQLGKRQEACTTLRGVTSKFPGAPAQLKAKADGERQRIGCP